MYTAFNPLDPTGQAYGQLVQPCYAKMNTGVLANSGLHVNLVMSFKKNHQIANIAMDYSDPLMTFVANVLAPVLGPVGDIRWIPRTKETSILEMPIRKPGGGYFLLSNNSTALDQGIRVAYTYLDKHYAQYGLVANPVDLVQPEAVGTK
jgi:hypothetical protein